FLHCDLIDLISGVKEELKTNNVPAAVRQIQEYLEKESNTPLNIAVTGETGSGKSSFVNAFRGINNKDKGAAPTGATETTMYVTPYLHPTYENVTLWDCPGIGSPNFPADKYLMQIGLKEFDFFIIMSADRFRENDVKIAQEIQKMNKKFYFVRSKIDHSLKDEEQSQNDFDAKKTLACIEKNCIDGECLISGIESPQVFLVSNFELHQYDFSRLHDTLERELPEHKRNALLFAMPNINLEIIDKKKEAFRSKIKYYALLSAAVAGVPIPGLSITVDITVLAGVITQYVFGFGLDIPSLERLSATTGVSFNDLLDVIFSPLAAVKITNGLILKVTSQLAGSFTLIAAEEACKWIPVVGIPVAMGFSFTSTYNILKSFLDMLALDAQRVFERALGLKHLC
uniref:IRG-type G domain-containing protein n=1 Tax=Amphilophus citrinellus TaxID=61819 RepID=A0A3Q0SCI5_AMPCI